MNGHFSSVTICSLSLRNRFINSLRWKQLPPVKSLTIGARDKTNKSHHALYARYNLAAGNCSLSGDESLVNLRPTLIKLESLMTNICIPAQLVVSFPDDISHLPVENQSHN